MNPEQLTLIASPLPAPPYPADVLANGWHFELAPSRIENSDTWTMAGQAVQRGGHDMRPWLLMLWMKAWQQSPCGSLPAQDELIAARIGMDPRLSRRTGAFCCGTGGRRPTVASTRRC